MGGAFMSEVPKEGETPSVLGSVVIAYAESKEEVLRDLKGDVYTESGVWDWDRVSFPDCSYVLVFFAHKGDCWQRGMHAYYSFVLTA